jgi:hypothetical protein
MLNIDWRRMFGKIYNGCVQLPAKHVGCNALLVGRLPLLHDSSHITCGPYESLDVAKTYLAPEESVSNVNARKCFA